MLCICLLQAPALGSYPNVDNLCLDGWIEANHLACFKLLHSAANLSWVEAQVKCETEGGYLAEPKTAR